MRYVIQKHTHKHNPTHWDLMIEKNSALETYRLTLAPADFASELIDAEKIHDHPLKFLSYQGPVNNDLGNVEIADKGECEIELANEKQLNILFTGKILKTQHTFNLI